MILLGEVFHLGVCTIQSAWFFLKFITEPIEIGFPIYSGAVFAVGLIGLVGLNI